jgi:N-acetylgalactosamine-6-sulfatase
MPARFHAMKSALLFLSFLLGATVSAVAAPANVVFILADDLGWGDLSCHGSTFIKTPHIDQLAKEGTDFREFYTASPVCSPSRVGFMTGQDPARFGVRSAISGVSKNREIPQVDWLDPKAVMLPRLLRDAGYATGHTGKWHLQSSQAGDAPLPEVYGVSETALFAGTSHPKIDRTISYHDIWKESIDFIKRHEAEPFYLNVWMHETHLAHEPTEEALKANEHLEERQRIYAAVATDADEGVGKILSTLKELGLEENTLVIFSSDNGPENTHPTMKKMRGGYGGYYSVGETGGHKGRKRSLHEGGVRTAFIVKWPGHIPANRVDEKTVISATDMLPTVCAAMNVALPAGYKSDGENMLPAWEGKQHPRTKPIFWDWSGTDRPPTNWCRWSIRDGDWKLLTDGKERKELYRITEDEGEIHEIASQEPEIVNRLQGMLDAWKASLPKEPPADCICKVRMKANSAADE